MDRRVNPRVESGKKGGHALDPLFSPQRIAVIGASATGTTLGNEFIRHTKALGYRGEIVPIHPRATEIEGIQAHPSFEVVSGIIDYAYVAVAADHVVPLIASAKGKLRFAQIISSGFGEISEGREREALLASAAREANVRLLGPNCLGVYSPRGRITFVGGSSGAGGNVGIVSQSGGLAVDLILRGKSRGLGFSGVTTIGNSIDLGPADLLDFHLQDDETRAIGFYLEDVKDGRRFFEILRDAGARKPVVLLVGGLTEQGGRAAASHTGSLATAASIWRGVAKQTGAVLVETVDELIDALVLFQSIVPNRAQITRSAVLFGNGGGTSVLAADAFARRGLDISRMATDVIASLEALRLPPGTSVVNPIDTPAATLRQEEGMIAGRILDIVFKLARPDSVVMHVNLPVFLSATDQRSDIVGNLMQAALRVQQSRSATPHFLLVLRSDGAPATEALKATAREQARLLGIPTFDELVNAASALAAIATVERFIVTRQPASVDG